MNNQLFSKLMFYITVPKCVHCKSKLDIDDKALCKECLKNYSENKLMNCPLCAKSYDKCSCSNNFLSNHGVKTLFKVFKYKAREVSPQNSLIFALKEENRRDVFSFCTLELSSSISNFNLNPEHLIITNIPRRRASISKYGYDQSKTLAKSIAKNLEIEYINLLRSNSQKAQKEMNYKERFKNIDYKLINDKTSLKGKSVIIVDDIVTTGSSMSSAAMLIRSLGAKRVLGATLGIAYRDDKLILDTSDRFIK